MPAIRDCPFDLDLEVPDDPYVWIGLLIFRTAWREMRSGNGKAAHAEEWLQRDEAWELGKLLFGKKAHVFHNWALAGFPDPEEARTPGMRALIERRIPDMEYGDYESYDKGVTVVDCKECRVAPQIEFLHSTKVCLQCPKCKKKSGYHFFVMEAADDWEEMNGD